MIRKTVLAVSACGLLTAVSGCGPTAYRITPVPISQQLVETTVRKDAGLFLPKIALIDVDGLLANARDSSLLGAGENPTDLAVEKLRKAAHDPAVKAVVLRINSPGGTVTASNIIYRQVVKVREGSDRYPGKPVAAMIMDVGASGGYYVACGANEIIAEPTAVTGSIGVMMQTFDIKGLFEKVGIRTDAIKSGAKKDAGSPFRPLEPEERKIFQDLINEFYDDFIAVVSKSRTDLDVDTLRKLADGRVYSGRSAEKLGLIDRTGGLDCAIDRAKTLAHVSAARVVMYHRPTGYRGTVYSRAATSDPGRTEFNLIRFDAPDLLRSQGYFMYLWQP